MISSKRKKINNVLDGRRRTHSHWSSGVTNRKLVDAQLRFFSFVSIRLDIDMSSAVQLKRFDAFAKTLDDFRVRTLTGGCVTICSSLIIFVVVVIELRTFFTVDIVQTLFVDTSREEKMNISLDIRFARLPCSSLTVDAMDVAGESQTDIADHLYKTRLDLHGRALESESKKISLSPANKTKVEETTNVCGSCYGAESTTYPCCSTCDEVKAAYRTKGWSFDPSRWTKRIEVKVSFLVFFFSRSRAVRARRQNLRRVGRLGR